MAAGAFNVVALRLVVTPDSAASAGSYPVAVTATSLLRAGVESTAVTEVNVGAGGVEVAIAPVGGTVDPRDVAVWEVTITNRGAVADTFDLAVGGALGALAGYPATTSALSPGQSQVIQVTVSPLDLLLPGGYEFVMTATSQADPGIRGEDRETVLLAGYEGLAVGWSPDAQTITGTLTARYLLVVTNTGSIEADVQLAIDGGSLQSALPLPELRLPVGVPVRVPVAVTAPGGGTYPLSATVTSAAASDSRTASLTVVAENVAPTANAGPDQSVSPGDLVTLDGSASSDVDGDLPLSYGWMQTGGPAVGLSDLAAAAPTFTAPAITTTLTFTLVVTDSLGLADPTPDEVVVAVEADVDDAVPPSRTLYLPLIANNR